MNFEDRINQHYHQLNDTDLHIIKQILIQKPTWSTSTLQSLSKITDSSTAAIIRMLQKLGYSGFSEFKFQMQESTKQKKDNPRPHNYADYILQSIQHTLDHVDTQKLHEVFEAMQKAKNIYAYGTGWKQSEALQAFSNDLMYYDRPMTILHTTSDINIAYLKMQDGDVFFLASLSGNTEGLEEIVRFLRLKGVIVISITSEGQNKLASLSDYRFYFADDSYFGLESLHWPALTLKALLDYMIHAYILFLE